MADNLYTPSWPLTHREYMNLVDRVNYLTTEVDRMRREAPEPGAKKERPIPGIITIPSPGGDGFIRVNEDGVIQSYTNPDSSAGVSKVIHVNVISVGNVGTGLDPLQTYTLPAGTLANNNDMLWVHYGGQFGANNDSKRIVVEFGGVTVHDPGLFSTNANSFVYDINYVRIDPVTIRSTFQASWGTINRDAGGTMSGSGLVFGRYTDVTPVPNLGTNDNVLRLLGESSTATDNNILHRKTVITLVKMS